MPAVLLVLGLVVGLVVARPAAMVRVRTELARLMPGKIKHAVAVALAWLGPASVGGAQSGDRPLPPPPPTSIGMNLPGIVPWGGTVAFANLAVGSDWDDSKWSKLDERYQDKDGGLRSLPPDGFAARILLIPPTGPAGINVTCSFQGSGALKLFADGEMLPAKNGAFRFHVVKKHDPTAKTWVIASNVDPARPMHGLDCREEGLPRTQRFRPTFLAALRGYRVIRFMDWQNANANVAVRWADRHQSGSLRVDNDGVAIEDMLALVRELNTDPWFVMPWNADDEYITRFAQLVRDQLPTGHRVYVEVGNEVWNGGFAVAHQAIAEGQARGLGDGITAGMRRYAQRTAEVMRLWERVFAGADRARLVRVLASQHGWSDTAKMALTFGDTAAHVDALATAPYFGGLMGGYANTHDSVVASLRAALPVTLQQAVANRRIAATFGKRYITYEGGEDVELPAQQQLTDELQHDPVQYDLYRQLLEGWRRDIGDVLCLYYSVGPPGGSGAWGLAAWEDETPAEAPKWRAVRDAMAAR